MARHSNETYVCNIYVLGAFTKEQSICVTFMMFWAAFTKEQQLIGHSYVQKQETRS